MLFSWPFSHLFVVCSWFDRCLFNPVDNSVVPSVSKSATVVLSTPFLTETPPHSLQTKIQPHHTKILPPQANDFPPTTANVTGTWHRTSGAWTECGGWVALGGLPKPSARTHPTPTPQRHCETPECLLEGGWLARIQGQGYWTQLFKEIQIISGTLQKKKTDTLNWKLAFLSLNEWWRSKDTASSDCFFQNAICWANKTKLKQKILWSKIALWGNCGKLHG